MLNQADEFVDKSIEIDQEFDFQNKRLEQTGDKLNEILGKVPIFNALFRSISFHRYKESLVLGLVVGLVMFFGLKLIFFKWLTCNCGYFKTKESKNKIKMILW